MTRANGEKMDTYEAAAYEARVNADAVQGVKILKVLSKTRDKPFEDDYTLRRGFIDQYTCIFEGETKPRTVPEGRLKSKE